VFKYYQDNYYNLTKCNRVIEQYIKYRIKEKYFAEKSAPEQQK